MANKVSSNGKNMAVHVPANDDEWLTIHELALLGIVALGFFGWFGMHRYFRYLVAKDVVEFREGQIQFLLERRNSFGKRHWQLLMDNNEKKRERAAAYMAKHKFAAKLAEIFPQNEDF